MFAMEHTLTYQRQVNLSLVHESFHVNKLASMHKMAGADPERHKVGFGVVVNCIAYLLK